MATSIDRKGARARCFWLRGGLAVGLGLLNPGPVDAHDFWIQPDQFWLASNAATGLTPYVGHGTARQVSMLPVERVTRFYSVGQAGRRDRRSELRLGGQDLTRVRFESVGLQQLGFETSGTYSELPGLRFTDYLKAEGLTPALAERERLGLADTPGREIYSRRAKALVQIGQPGAGDAAVVTAPLGMSLEIVPERNPYATDFDGILPVRIYYNGRPLAGALVKLNNLDFDNRPIEQHLSDATGRARFRLPLQGGWQLNVIWTRPIVGDPRADFETVFSSLALGYTGR